MWRGVTYGKLSGAEFEVMLLSWLSPACGMLVYAQKKGVKCCHPPVTLPYGTLSPYLLQYAMKGRKGLQVISHACLHLACHCRSHEN
jgi:hypothetical protein